MYLYANQAIADERRQARQAAAERSRLRRSAADASRADAPRRGRRRAAAALAVATCAIAAGSGCFAVQHRGDLDAGWTCAVADGQPRAAGTVTNHSTQSSTYWIEISFSRDGVGFSNRTAYAEDVAPGAQAPFEVSGRNDPGDGDLDCTVVAVNRVRA